MLESRNARLLFAALVTFFLVPGLLLASSGRVLAQDPQEESESGEVEARVGLSEESLRFHGVVNESLQRTFTLQVTGGSISGLAVVVHDLVDDDTGLAILSTDINVDPSSKDRVEEPELFSVTIGAGQKPGHYVGRLDIMYEDQPEDEALAVELDVILDSVPAVEAEVNSKNLVLSAVPAWLSLPFGRPSVPENAQELGEVTLVLIQDAEGEATVEQIDILTIRGSKNETLPQDAIAVTTDLPLKLFGQDAASIRIVAQGRNLPADSYATTVRAKVRNQTASVQVPLTVQIKDGPLLPLLLLAVGPLVGVLIGLWNQQGKAKYDLQRRIEKLRRRIESGDYIQEDERAQAMRDLEKAMDAMINGEDVTLVTERVQAVDTYITEKYDAARAFAASDVAPLTGLLGGISVGVQVRDDIVNRVQDLEDAVKSGEFHTLKDAKALSDGLNSSAAQLKALADQFEALPDGKDKDAKRVLLDRATKLAEMELILNPPTAGAPLSGAQLAGDAALSAVRKPVTTEWDKYKLRLNWWRLAISAIVYVFTLVVGWLMLYSTSPTFGATPEDYVTLFLWGVAASAVGAGTISLQSIFEKAKEPQPAAPPTP